MKTVRPVLKLANSAWKPAKSTICISFDEKVGGKKAQRLSLVGEESFRTRIELPKQKFTLFHSTLNDKLKNVATATRPVFSGPGDLLAVCTNQILVWGKSEELKNWKVDALLPGSDDVSVVTLAISEDPYRICEDLQRKNVKAWPNHTYFKRRSSLETPNMPTSKGSTAGPFEQISKGSRPDPLEQYAWAMETIQAKDAWSKFGKGDEKIVIAIIDEGVDTKHPDLKDRIVLPFDAIDNDRNQEPEGDDAHGTACAGLAAAIPENEIGIRGVGGGCSIMPIRVAHTDPQDPCGGWELWRDCWFVRGIRWAVDNGAHILSCSWGWSEFTGAIACEIERALERGCSVVAAAGNKPGPVNFPANIPGVIAVSASNNLDEFKRYNDGSYDGSWGSGYGPEIWIAAPGVRMVTTDIVGPRGHGTGNSAVGWDYDEFFRGTSSAVPCVAGCIGFMLSVNPNLNSTQVREILKITADKKGTDPYDKQGRNDFFGYGRLNVYKAVEEAKRRASGQHPTVLKEDKQSLKGFISRSGSGFYQLHTTDQKANKVYQVRSWQFKKPENSQESDRKYFKAFVDKHVICYYTKCQDDVLYGWKN